MSRASWSQPAVLVAVLFAVLIAGLLAAVCPSARAEDAAPPAAIARADSVIPRTHEDSLAAAARDSLAALDALPNPFVRAPRDTSGAPFHYNTGYSINRNLSNWNQVLNVDTYWKDVHIDNATTVAFREDTDRHTRSGTRTQNLRLDYDRHHGLVAGLALEMERDNDGPIVNGRVQSNSSLDNTSYRLTLADSLYISEINFFKLGLEGGRVSRDETGGVKRTGAGNDILEKLEWTFVPKGPLKIQASASNSSAVTDAEGTQAGVGSHGQDTTLFASTRNRNKALNLNWQSRLNLPWHSLGAVFGATHSDTRQQQPTAGRQETLTQKTDNVNGTLNVSLTEGLLLNVDASVNKNVVLSDVDSSRNYNTHTTGGTMVLTYNNPRLGSLHTSLGNRLSTNDFRNRLSGDLQDMSVHSFSATFNRLIAGGLYNLQLNMSMDLSATRYNDTLVTATPAYNPQDQDYLNRRIGGTLQYSPPGRISMTLQASEVLNHYVYLHAKQSGKSATDRLYSIEYDINFGLSQRLSVSQSYIVSADANIYDFENYPGIASDNRYTKTTTYTTNMRHRITNRITNELTHSLRLSRGGSYDLDPVTLGRLFGESSAGQTNDLLLRSSCVLAPGISLVASTRAQFIHADGLESGGNTVPASRQKILEFNLGLNMNYKFSERARLTGLFSRSARSDIYTPYSNGAPGAIRNNSRDYFLISATFDLVVR